MNTHQENRTIQWVAMNGDLLTILKSQDNHRFSRYDAFIWLLEHIKGKKPLVSPSGIMCRDSEYSASYNRLADAWHWSRPTVQKFIEELTTVSVITKRRNGNTFIFSLNDKSQDKVIL